MEKTPRRERGQRGNLNKTRAMTEAISLRQLQVGKKAKISAVSAEGEMGRRIRDMGLMPGEQVEVVGRAPLKDPVALRLKGFTLSLRNNEANFITVTPIEQQ